jgi:hypothetical protein
VIPGPVEVPADSGARRLHALLASFMWGLGDLDELVMRLEDEYWRALRGTGFDTFLKTRLGAGEAALPCEGLSGALTGREGWPWLRRDRA